MSALYFRCPRQNLCVIKDTLQNNQRFHFHQLINSSTMAHKQKFNKQPSHTIILYQVTAHPSSRSYRDFESVRDSMVGICEMFEEKLKKEHRNQTNITYGIKDLFAWIDSLGDMGALVFSHSVSAYEPKNKDWIKEKVYKHLQRQARQ